MREHNVIYGKGLPKDLFLVPSPVPSSFLPKLERTS